MRGPVALVIGSLLAATVLIAPAPAGAIPAFSRMFGQSCAACHSGFPRLNRAGEEFRLSGYTRFEGGTAVPKVPPLVVGKLALPGVLPVSVVGTVGFDFHKLEERARAEGTTKTFDPNSINLEEIELLSGAPLNNHLSFFLDFPLAETEFGDEKKFELEGPRKPMLAAISLNNLLTDDVLNLRVGVYELPLGVSPEHRRLSVAPFEIYAATAQSLLGLEGGSKTGISNKEAIFSLQETQLLAEVYGNLYSERLGIPGLQVRYHIGTANDSNVNADNNSDKGVFGRLELGYGGQTLGFFGYWTPNILDRSRPPGFLGGKNSVRRLGPDLQLRFFDERLNITAQYLWAHDSNPTGVGEPFDYSGGFAQIDTVLPAGALGTFVPLVRFDYVKGDKFDDTERAKALAQEAVRTEPRIWAVTAGVQYYAWENVKFVAEATYRRTTERLSNTTSTAEKDRVREVILGIRVQVGF